jgi:hypothetical protein
LVVAPPTCDRFFQIRESVLSFAEERLANRQVVVALRIPRLPSKTEVESLFMSQQFARSLKVSTRRFGLVESNASMTAPQLCLNQNMTRADPWMACKQILGLSESLPGFFITSSLERNVAESAIGDSHKYLAVNVVAFFQLGERAAMKVLGTRSVSLPQQQKRKKRARSIKPWAGFQRTCESWMAIPCSKNFSAAAY